LGYILVDNNNLHAFMLTHGHAVQAKKRCN
jgi:hypothetical protein